MNRKEPKRREPKEKQICATDSSDKRQSESRTDRWTSRPGQDISDPEWIKHESTHTLKKHGDFGSNTDELFAPEFIFLIPEKLNKCDQCAPRVRTVDDKTLQENPSHHLTEAIVLDLNEEVEQERGEPVGMGVGISQVEHHGAQEVVLS